MRRSKKHTKRRRSRRVGALGIGKGDTGLKLLSIAGGFFLGNTINTQIDKMLPKEPPPAGSTTASTAPSKTAQTAAMVGEIGLGGLLLLRKRSPMMLKVAGGVLAGAGIKRALNVMGVLTGIGGYQSVPVIGTHRMAGYQNVPVIGANPVPSQLAGARTPPQLSGYRPAGSGVGGYLSQGTGVLGSVGNCDKGTGITSTDSSGYMN
jgi:hypothetical protein